MIEHLGDDERDPIASSAVWLAQSLTRRSFVARLLKVGLAAVGLTTTYMALSAPQTTLASNCNNCYWCGVCGTMCDGCGGSDGACPSGTAQGTSSWSACCLCGTCSLTRYKDCCGTSKCNGQVCPNICPRDTWCAGSGYSVYVCTVAVTAGSCGPC